jgi:predicted aspartyl protease
MLGEWAVVEVHLGHDQRPYRFIVDTAAGATVIDRRLAAHLDLKGRSGNTTVHGASDAGASYGQGKLDRIEVASRSVGPLDIVVTDMASFGIKTGSHYDGILGNDVLRRFTYVFDVPHGRLSLVDAKTPDRTAWRNCSPNPYAGRTGGEGGFVATKVSLLGGAAATAIVDTGAVRTVMNWPAAHAQGLAVGSPDVSVGRKVIGLDPKSGTISYEAAIRGASINQTLIPAMHMRISDLPVFAGFDLAARSGLILGLDVTRTLPFAVGKNVSELCTAVPHAVDLHAEPTSSVSPAP